MSNEVAQTSIEIITPSKELVEFTNPPPTFVEIALSTNEVIEFKTPTPLSLEIVTPAKEIIEFKVPNPTIIEMQYTAPGPKGDPGEKGDPGQPGGSYTHTQIAASTSWYITHNLGKKPSVSIVDSADTLIVGEVVYLDDNHCQVELSMAISGKAYCN